MLKSVFVLVLMAWLYMSSIAQPIVRFTIKNAGFSVEGTFTDVQASVFLDSISPQESRVDATASVRTIQTGISARDRHLLKPEYFDSDRFPIIRLRALSVNLKGRGVYEGTFELTIKGVKKSLKIPFYQKGTQLTATYKINRLEFGVGEKSWMLGDEVQVFIAYPYP